MEPPRSQLLKFWSKRSPLQESLKPLTAPLRWFAAFLLCSAFGLATLPLLLTLALEFVGNEVLRDIVPLAWSSALQLETAEEIYIAIGVAGLLISLYYAMHHFCWSLGMQIAKEAKTAMRRKLMELLVQSELGALDARSLYGAIEPIVFDTTRVAQALQPVWRLRWFTLPALVFTLASGAFLNPWALPFMFLGAFLCLQLLRSYNTRLAFREIAQRGERRKLQVEVERMARLLPQVKAFTLHDKLMQNFEERSQILSEFEQGTEAITAWKLSVTGLAKAILRGGLMALNSWLIIRHELALSAGIGSFAALEVIFYLSQEVAETWARVQPAQESAARLRTLSEDLREIQEDDGSLDIVSLPFPDATALHFENVSLDFANGTPILQDFSAVFHAGEVVRITGRMGVGKSQIVRLITRLSEPKTGRVLLGRTDLRKFRLHRWRNYVSFLSEEPFFIPGTLQENLCLAREGAVTDQELNEALSHSDSLDIVNELPAGLETLMESRDLRLSRSQQKQLHLARAFLRPDSQIFVFDEPARHMGPEAIRQITRALENLADRGALVFVVEDQPTLPLKADQTLIVQSHGRVEVQKGDKSVSEVFVASPAPVHSLS